jgi:4-amino-4-deoxy-L-arabinose transferase-like glycosyltransferase
MALALARSLVLGWATPPYQSSDEPWHLDYARSLAHGRLPVLGQTRLDPAIVAHDKRVTAERGLTLYGIDAAAQSREALQPPLGYVLPAVAYRLLGSDPGRGLIAFRTIDALLGAALAVLAFHFGRVAFPTRRYAAPLAGVAAVGLPSGAMVASTAANDALAAVLSLGALVMAIEVARRGASTRRCLALGAVVGLAALTKATGLLLLAPAVLAVTAGRGRRKVAGAAWCAAAAGAVLAPWAARNLAVYGEPFGTSATGSFLPLPASRLGGWRLLLGARPTNPVAQPFWPELGRTSVGVLRWTDLELAWWAYALAGAVAAAGVVALARWVTRSARPDEQRSVALAALTALALIAAVWWYAYSLDYQPQGRYLVAGLLALAAAVGAAVGRRGFVMASATFAVLMLSAVVTTLHAYG